MQLLILALLLGLFLHDQFGPAAVAIHNPWTVAGLMLAAPVLLAGIYTLFCRLTLHALGKKNSHARLRRLDRITTLYRLAVLTHYSLALFAGMLTWLRGYIGNLLLVDELIFLTPSLTLILWGWIMYYPIDYRLRQATWLSRLDAGLPVHPIWTRGQYLVAQLRHQVALIGLPLILLLGWQEITKWLLPKDTQMLGLDVQQVVTLAGAASVFLFAPLLFRHVWDTIPLPPGEPRDRLTRMCQNYRVGVRQILLWRTFGGMINAAVMGLIAPLRYILLTDALLEMVPLPQVEAVMAHELAHIRKHHMLWLLIAAGACIEAPSLVFARLVEGLTASAAWRRMLARLPEQIRFILHHHDAPDYIVLALTGLVFLLLFGWISRRFERQADTFAVQHLARQQSAPPDPAGPTLVDQASADTMCQALQAVADLNCLAPNRKSWRHGSIIWRQNHLRRLVGQPINTLAIDRQVRLINTLSLLTLLAGIAVEIASSISPP